MKIALNSKTSFSTRNASRLALCQIGKWSPFFVYMTLSRLNVDKFKGGSKFTVNLKNLQQFCDTIVDRLASVLLPMFLYITLLYAFLRENWQWKFLTEYSSSCSAGKNKNCHFFFSNWHYEIVTPAQNKIVFGVYHCCTNGLSTKIYYIEM